MYTTYTHLYITYHPPVCAISPICICHIAHVCKISAKMFSSLCGHNIKYIFATLLSSEHEVYLYLFPPLVVWTLIIYSHPFRTWSIYSLPFCHRNKKYIYSPNFYRLKWSICSPPPPPFVVSAWSIYSPPFRRLNIKYVFAPLCSLNMKYIIASLSVVCEWTWWKHGDPQTVLTFTSNCWRVKMETINVILYHILRAL